VAARGKKDLKREGGDVRYWERRVDPRSGSFPCGRNVLCHILGRSFQAFPPIDEFREIRYEVDRFGPAWGGPHPMNLWDFPGTRLFGQSTARKVE